MTAEANAGAERAEPNSATAAEAAGDGISIDVDGAVLVLTIDRPHTRNALDAHLMDVLIDRLDAAGQDESVRSILLRSAGVDFCSGADLVARNAPGGAKPRVGSIQRRLPTQAHRLVPTMLSVQVPIVCAVRGWAAGLGFHLALASDFCVASTTARFWEPFASRGFTPDSGGTWLLPRLVGVARARELLLLGRELSGSDALAWGLIHQAVPDDELDEVALTLASELAEGPTVALGLTKWLINVAADADIDTHLRNEAFALELSSRSQDFREGLVAFRDRRAPAFEGR
jgi:2-(1,2-epoxy-1,2-dihydrophenyl)acetyl-CoA isomerase